MTHELLFLNSYQAAAQARLEALAGRSLTESEIAKLAEVTAQRCRDSQAVIYNPQTERNADTSLGRVAGWLTSRKPMAPIVTGHGTIFKPHDEFKSTVGEMVDFLMKTRKVAKNQMFDLMRDGRPPEDPEVKALDQRQKIFKLLANSFYGAKSFQVL